MNDNHRQDDRLERLLQRRHTPDAPDGLARRIIEAAGTPSAAPRLVRPARTNSGIGRFFADLRGMIAIPQPAFACALALVFGVVIGIEMDWMADPALYDWAGLFVSGENWL